MAGPEPVRGIKVAGAGLDLGASRWWASSTLLHHHSVQGKLQKVVGQRLVGPRVVKGRRHVHVTV